MCTDLLRIPHSLTKKNIYLMITFFSEFLDVCFKFHIILFIKLIGCMIFEKIIQNLRM